jgi:RNA polymerase-associated protein
MKAHPVRNVIRDANYPLNTNNMALYSGTTCPFSHRCRIVLYEKQMDFQLIDIDQGAKPEDMADINPHSNTVPVLVHRDLVLQQANVINEYLDERFPHPQLMPTDIQDRARARQLLHTMDRELYSHIDVLENNLKSADKSRNHLRNRLNEMSGLFGKQKYLLGNAYSMLDVAIAPLLWRLDHYGIQLPGTAAPLLNYAQLLFSRQGFIDALTPSEKLLRR